jgi:hypothetical protein
MALPLLFSFLGGGLAKAGVLGAAGSFLANPLVASAIGSGLGTLIETGDPKKAVLGGLGSFAGGSLLGGMMGAGAGSSASGALKAPLAGQSVVGAGANAMTTGTPLFAQPGMAGSALLPPPAAPASGIAGLFGGRAGDITSAGMEFAKSGAGIGSMLGGALPTMFQKAPGIPQEQGPDISQTRAMNREVTMPGQGFNPGVSGEFDYGVSAPYTSNYMRQYSPQRLAMGGFVDNPYAQNYAEERGQMLAGLGVGQPPMPMGQPMRMAEGGMVADPRLGVEVDYGFGMPVSVAPQPVTPAQGPAAPSPWRNPVFNTPPGTRSIYPEEEQEQRLQGFLFNPAPTAPVLKEFEMPARRQPVSAPMVSRQVVTPTQYRLTSSELNSLLGDFPRPMAQGGQVMQRNDPFYGPVMMQEGGIANVGAMPQDPPAAMPNEREVISAAVAAVQGQHPQPEVALGLFLQQYGEEALRKLVDRVQSGEFQDTQERFANGENGEVRGPGDGSGTDDMVPAVVDGQSDVLLSDGEFVIRKDATDALNNAFGKEFMDKMNSAGSRAPEVVKQMVA